MDFEGLFNEWKRQLRRLTQRRAASAELLEEGPAAKSATIGKHLFVFGLDWRFYSDNKDLRQTLGSAQRSGGTHYVTTTTEDLVGVAHGIDLAKPSKTYSAALQLAESVSKGGVELFVFQLSEDLYSITALHDSRPVAQFDQLGSRGDILALAGQFQISQVAQTIRQAGNTGALENEEPLKLSEAFADPDGLVRLKKLPNYKQWAIIFVGIAVVAVAIWMIWAWMNAENLKLAREKQVREQDPNFIYEKIVTSGMKSTGFPAQAQLDAWRQTVKGIPMLQNGWGLAKINCQVERCDTYWERDFGNYKEFYSLPIAGVIASTESQKADNPAQAGIQTVLKVPVMSATQSGLERATLPLLRDSLQLLSSQLQDMSLLSNSTVQLKAPALYPSAAGLKPQDLAKPVLQGEWSLTHEMWSLMDIEFKGPALVLQNLLIHKDEKTGIWLYTLTGNYYAKGKDF